MGQYYKTITVDDAGHFTAYNRKVIENGEEHYTMAKLLEHSWWENPFVNAIAETIYNDASRRVVWLGDYSDEFMEDYPDGFNGISKNRVCQWHNIVWGEHSRDKAIETTDFTLDNKFLINHTKKIFIDCSEYFKRSVTKKWNDDGWCIHPLPLLTCIGNGCGGGDYRFATEDSTVDMVGTWAFDEIGIEDEKPTDYTEVFPTFKEQD